jgi:DNA polymerase V
LEEVTPPRKAIISSRSFGKPVESLTALSESVAFHAAIAAEKLRSQQSIAAILQVFIVTNTCKEHEPQYAQSRAIRLPLPTSSTPDLIQYAEHVLRVIYKPGYRYKKAGVIITDIVPEHNLQLNLFVAEPHAGRARHLMKAIDQINCRWGGNTVFYAAAGIHQPWRMRRARQSPRVTTCWEELHRVTA